MKKMESWLLLGTLVLAVTGCDKADTPSNQPDSDRSEVRSETASSGDADLFLQDLNDRLEPSRRCEIDAPHLAADYAERIPHRDIAACRFSDGSPLIVIVGRSGEKTYKRYFGRQFGPNYFLYGRDWLIVASIGTPQRVLEVLREDLGAVG